MDFLSELKIKVKVVETEDAATAAADTVDMERHAMEVERMAEAGMDRTGRLLFVSPTTTTTTSTPPPPPPSSTTTTNSSPPGPPSLHRASGTTTTGGDGGGGGGGGGMIPPPSPQFAVYSPVDGTHTSWNAASSSSAGRTTTTTPTTTAVDDDEKKNDDVDEDYSRRRRRADDDGKGPPAPAAAASPPLSPPAGAAAAATATTRRWRQKQKQPVPITPNEEDDVALARAVAEQDLPPGVSAAEQQEVMMRLLTQRIRRGDWNNNATTGAGGEGDGEGEGGGEGGEGEKVNPALEERLRDFNFARENRREKYGENGPWGILALYDHLAGIRLDVEWAEDAAWRRSHDEPYVSWKDFQTTRDVGWNRPFFTYFLLVACTAALIASYGVNGWRIEPLSVNPMIGPSAQTLIEMGAKQTTLIVDQGEWYRLFSPMVLHAGLIHYFLNMTALWFIGQAVEQCHGFAAAVILFVLPALGGTILSAIFLSEYITVGASGGIFGLIGACVADICMNWSLLFSKHVNASDKGVRFRHIKVLLWLLFDIVINCLIGLTPFVDNFTHLGGMVYGFLCGLSTMERLSTDFFGVATTFWTRVRNVLIRFSGLILSIVLIMITTSVLVDLDVGGPSPCPGCRYVSCVPFPPWASEDNKWWHCDDCAMVTADAKLDSSGYYSLSMTCPDGQIEEIDLSDQLVTDRQWIQRQLPTMCRKYCDQVFNS